jgi:hypothetical protein
MLVRILARSHTLVTFVKKKKSIHANRKLLDRDVRAPEKNSLFVKYEVCVFRIVRTLPDTNPRIQGEIRERVIVLRTAALTMYVLVQ